MSEDNTIAIIDLSTIQRGIDRRVRVVTYPSSDPTDAEETATEWRTRSAEPGATGAHSLGRFRPTRTRNDFVITLGIDELIPRKKVAEVDDRLNQLMFPVAILVVDDALELTLGSGVYERAFIWCTCNSKVLRAGRVASKTRRSEKNWGVCSAGPAGIATRGIVVPTADGLSLVDRMKESRNGSRR